MLITRFAMLAAVLLCSSASAQSGRIVLSLDQYRIDNITNESRHEILPVAIYDGTSFHPVLEWDRTLGASSRRPYLLSNYPEVRVLHRGRRIGGVRISNIEMQTFHCSSLLVGSGEYTEFAPQPKSQITDAVSGSDRVRFDYETQGFLALSGALNGVPTDAAPLLTEIEDPDQLQRLADDIETYAPRQALGELGTDKTRAWQIDGDSAALVVRKRRSARMIAGPGNSEYLSNLYTDIAVVHIGNGQRSVLPLNGAGTMTDAMGKGPNDEFIDAFELADGRIWLAFMRRNYEVWQFRLYGLRANGDTWLELETELYGC